MPLSALEYLRHILDETGYLMERAQGLTHEQFMRDATLKRAFVRSIEIIGEASKQIPDDMDCEGKRHQRRWRVEETGPLRGMGAQVVLISANSMQLNIHYVTPCAKRPRAGCAPSARRDRDRPAGPR